MSEIFRIDATQYDDLQLYIKSYEGDAEQIINDVLHDEGSSLIQNEIRNLMPQSNRKPWKGKKKEAKTSNSLKDIKSNLAITITTTSNYQYLYFPNDGTNTRNHIGNKQFFAKGVENTSDNIINLCIERLVNK